MKRKAITGLIIVLVLAAAVSLVAEDKKANELLQSGITRETVQGDLKGAIELYEKAAKEAGANRSIAAKAQMRLGAAYQKQGDVQARAVFERVVRDYADQTAAVSEAQTRLAALGSAPSSMIGVTYVDDRNVAGTPVSASGQLRQIMLFDRQGKSLGTVGDPGPVGTMTISPDGKRVALVRGGAIVVYDIAKKTVIKVTSSGVNQPTWSPDGRRMAFQRGSSFYITPSDGTGIGREELVASISGSGLTLVSWSPDGRFLTYQVQGSGTAYDSWLVPITGDRKPLLILQTPFNDSGPRISPDGRFFSYRSNESGRSEVYVRPFDSTNPTQLPTADKWKISADPGVATAGARWRSDGKEIYYLSAGGGMMAVEVTTTPSFKAGTPKLLFQIPAAYQSASNNTAGYSDESPDGKIFALLVPTN